MSRRSVARRHACRAFRSVPPTSPPTGFYRLTRYDDDAEGTLPETREFLGGEVLEPVAEKWKAAADALIPVPEMPADIDMVASIAKGRELFYGDRANCVKLWN